MQGVETLFVADSVTARTSLYQHVPKLMEACGDKQKPVAQAAATLTKMMYAECQPWSGGYVLPLLKDSLMAKAKPEVKQVAREALADLLGSIPKAWPWKSSGAFICGLSL